jgi:hypothetical protein
MLKAADTSRAERGPGGVRGGGGVRIPSTFAPVDLSESEAARLAGAAEQQRARQEAALAGRDSDGRIAFQPPASDDPNVYNILKFYHFDSTAVQSILSPGSKVEVPFVVTEKEYEIINLQPDPAASILLLGRSGTGKTTVLVFRMWGEFKAYWERARRVVPDGLGGEDVFYDRLLPPADGGADTGAEGYAGVGADHENEATQAGDGDAAGGAADSGKAAAGGGGGKQDPGGGQRHLHTLFLTRNPVLCDEVSLP